MAFVPFDDCVSVTICATLAGQKVCLTLSFCQPDFGTSEMDMLAAIIEDWLNDALCTDLSDDIVFNNINITDLRSISAPSIDYAVTEPGQVASPSVPNGAAVVVTFGTDNRGRSFRGRNYVPGVPESAKVDSGNISTSVANDLRNDYALLFSAAQAESWTQVVASRFSNNVQRETGVSTQITSWVCNTAFDSQRRRNPGRGD